MTSAEIVERTLRLLRGQASFPVLSQSQRDLQNHSPELLYLAPLMRAAATWKPPLFPQISDRLRVDMMGSALASYLLHDVFTPLYVPPALYRIYDVLEPSRSVIITYNYDRITDEVLAEHDRR